jgi:hypothetical protein
VTEIPEHLLKRSQERRAAAGGGDASAPPAAAASGAVVPAAPAAAAKPAAPAKAAPAAPPPPKPDPPYVAAAKSRKRIPFWAMATLSLLPIWGFMYVQGVKPQAKEVHGPLGDGVEVYTSCSTCHGAAGGGGVGRPFIEGSVERTFPHIEDQLNLVYVGSKAYADAGVGAYGDPAAGHTPGSYNGSFMPAQGTGLSEAQILAVVCHERYDLGGVSPTDPAWATEFDTWCAEGSEIYAGLEDGSLTFDNLHDEVEGVLPVGTEPRPGTPAGAAAGSDAAPVAAAG